MSPGLTSVVVPTFNHAAHLWAAVNSVLAQSAAVECIIVDDGSTDDTAAVLLDMPVDSRSRAYSIPHAGVAAARNFGISQARGEYLMFLDADDWIDPEKIELQLAEFGRWPSTGWVYCDTKIIEVSGRTELASVRYDYAAIESIERRLAEGNFLPVHAPLIRRQALRDIRFPSGKLEDWTFWRMLAAVAPARYIPDVLCEYRRRRGGRNST